jgi:hypothetical protein
MFITQPPCRNVGFDLTARTHLVLAPRREVVRDVKGVRLGKLVDEILKILDHARDDGMEPGVYPSAEANTIKGHLSPVALEKLVCYIDGFIVETAPLLQSAKLAESSLAQPNER